MKVLITGGMGFIGKALVEKLLGNDIESIIVLDNLSPQIHGPDAIPSDFQDERILFIKGNVSKYSDIAPLLLSSDVVVHLAAETGTGQSMYKIELYDRVNIGGTALMFDILSSSPHRVKKFILASSRAVYGEGKYECAKHGDVFPGSRLEDDLRRGDFAVKCPFCRSNVQVMPTGEESLLHPISFYGITKQFQESIVMTLSPALNIKPVALRFQNVFGPGQSLHNPYTGILSIFSNLIRSGKRIEIFEDGTESRDFIYIEDVAESIVTALFSEEADGEIFNIGSGKRTTVLEVARLLEELFGAATDIKINGKYRLGDIRHNYADMEKSRQLLGFKARMPFEAGLKKFVEWVKKQDVGTDLFQRSLNEMSERGLYK